MGYYEVFTNYNFLRNDYPMVHYLFFFTPKEPKMVLLVSSEILLLQFSTAVRYESANFFKLIPEGLSYHQLQNFLSTFCQF